MYNMVLGAHKWEVDRIQTFLFPIDIVHSNPLFCVQLVHKNINCSTFPNYQHKKLHSADAHPNNAFYYDY